MPNQHNREVEQAHRVVGMLFIHQGLAGDPIFVPNVQTTTKKSLERQHENVVEAKVNNQYLSEFNLWLTLSEKWVMERSSSRVL